MIFMEALAELQKGNYVSRNAWDATGEYVVFLPGMQYLWKVMFQPNPAAGNWLPMMADLLADDYKVVNQESVAALDKESNAE